MINKYKINHKNENEKLNNIRKNLSEQEIKIKIKRDVTLISPHDKITD
jgi:hypothetical protein